VVDSLTGAPVESAEVTIGRPSSMKTSSNEGGWFAFRNLPKGSYFVTVSKDGSGVISATRFVTLREGNKATVDFKMLKEASISGRVVNEAGIGIPGVRVQALINGTRCSRDGSHRPIVIGEGPLALRLKSDGASLSGTVTTEDASGSLPDRGIVLVFDTEKGLVRLSQLDQENKFSFQGLPPGAYKVMALFGIERDSLESPLVFQRWLSQAQDVSLSPYAARDIEIHPVVVRR
jgi:hypothetical protein